MTRRETPDLCRIRVRDCACASSTGRGWGGLKAACAEDDCGAHLAEFGCALHRAGEAKLESAPDAHAEERARIERGAARGLARVEGSVGREREDQGVRFLVPVVAGLGRGVPAQGPCPLPAEDGGAVE